MSPPPFAARLAACRLDRLPAADQAELQKLVAALDAAAERLRGPYGWEEEPSNVFRLRAALAAAGGGEARA